MRNALPLFYAMILCCGTMNSALAEEQGESKRFVVTQSTERMPIMLEVTAVDADSNTISVKQVSPPGGEARSIEPGVYLGVGGKSISKKPEFALSIHAKDKFVSEGSFTVDAESIKAFEADYRLVAIPLTKEESEGVSLLKGIAKIQKGAPPAEPMPADKKAKKSSELDELASLRNMKEIGLALFTYTTVQNGFPPAVIYGPDGKPWHSWRVLVAPYLEDPNARLVGHYKFDEPWDGPSNKKFLKAMPKVFAGPGADVKEGMTPYLAFVGEGAAFTGRTDFKIDKGATQGNVPKKDQTFHEFRDGSSNSLLVGFAHTEVPWTKPEDIAVTNGKAGLKKKGGVGFAFGSKDDARTQLLFADGHVDRIGLSDAENVLPKLISIAGGEMLELPVPESKVPKKEVRGRVTFVEVDGKWTAYLEG